MAKDDASQMTRRQFVATGCLASASPPSRLDTVGDDFLVPRAESNWSSERFAHGPVVLRMRRGSAMYLSTEDALVSLSLASGREQWRFERVSDYPFVAPEHVAEGSLLVPGDDRIYCLDAADGAERWRVALPESETTPELRAYDGRAYLAGDALRAVSLRRGGLDWTFDPPDSISGTLPGATSVYVGTSEGTIHALSRDTGGKRWRFEASGRTGRSYSQLEPVGVPGGVGSADGAPSVPIYAWSRRDGRLHAVSRNDGAQRWQFVVDGEHVAFPGVITTESVYLIDGTDLLSLSPRDGSVRWRFDAKTDLKWYFSVVGDTAYARTADELRAIDVSDGTSRWQFSLDDGRAVVVPEDGISATGRGEAVTSAVALDPRSGAVRWTFDARNPVESVLVGANGVYLSTTAGTVSAISSPKSPAAAIRRTVRRDGLPLVTAGTAVGVALLGAYRRFGPETESETTVPESLTPTRKIGESEYAEVHRARDGSGEPVAFKRFSTDSPAVTEALDEWACVDARGVCPVLDHGTDPDPWVALPLADETLAERTDDLSLESGARTVATVATIVHRLHRAGTVHGHLVPENVLFAGSAPTVSDCGLRTAATGREPTIADDVYDLGELAHRVLFGRAPTEDVTPSSLGPQETLAEVLSTALADDPTDRYESALKFADALRWAVRE